MQTPIVMTIIGKDRPGLVELLAGTITANDGNWLESRMALLGGQFAGILRVTVPENRRAELLRNLEALSGRGLQVHVQEDAPVSPKPDRTAVLRLVGHDRPGIVRHVSQALAQHGINVEELSTQCSSAPMTGEPLFQAEAKVQVPPGCSLTEVKATFEQIAADLTVDISLEELR